MTATHTAVDDYTCSCGWTVDSYTAPEIARWKLKTKHLGGFTGTETPSPAHVMVTPGYPPVRIGDGPTISTKGDDSANHVRINGIPQYMPHPYPNPVPIHGTPYEAYAHGEWALNVFAIRLREQAVNLTDVCGRNAGRCVCTEHPGHTGPHVCDNPNFSGGTCGGSWQGDIDDDGSGAFTIVRLPNIGPDTTTPDNSQDDEPETCIRRGGICWPIDPAIEAAFNEAKGQQP